MKRRLAIAALFCAWCALLVGAAALGERLSRSETDASAERGAP